MGSRRTRDREPGEPSSRRARRDKTTPAIHEGSLVSVSSPPRGVGTGAAGHCPASGRAGSRVGSMTRPLDRARTSGEPASQRPAGSSVPGSSWAPGGAPDVDAVHPAGWCGLVVRGRPGRTGLADRPAAPARAGRASAEAVDWSTPEGVDGPVGSTSASSRRTRRSIRRWASGGGFRTGRTPPSSGLGHPPCIRRRMVPVIHAPGAWTRRSRMVASDRHPRLRSDRSGTSTLESRPVLHTQVVLLARVPKGPCLHAAHQGGHLVLEARSVAGSMFHQRDGRMLGRVRKHRAMETSSAHRPGLPSGTRPVAPVLPPAPAARIDSGPPPRSGVDPRQVDGRFIFIGTLRRFMRRGGWETMQRGDQ